MQVSSVPGARHAHATEADNPIQFPVSFWMTETCFIPTISDMPERFS